jgi:uncharacterized protein YjbJ (UPF0337 family)
MAEEANDKAKEATGAVTGDEKEKAGGQTERKHAAREASPQEQETRQEQTESEQARED